MTLRSLLWLPGCLLVALIVGLWPASQAMAKDVRYALLVANQRGWQRDPPLRYAIRGDLEPMARMLRRLGFEVVTLSNRDATALRKAFALVAQRLRRAPKITTFLFYYSGHADQTHLHLGPKGKTPFSYREFASRFQQIRIIRKFAIFDACFSGEVIRLLGSLQHYKSMVRQGQSKGIQRRTTFDISKLKIPNQGNEQGTRVISSSLRLSWEIDRYRASVFTYFLLKGLRGEADLDRDGKISIDELFDYTSRHVEKETGQKPEQLILARRGNPYALAPAYRSQLSIRADVIGKLRVSVGNFMWVYHKRKRKKMLLSVVDGKGEVMLVGERHCWRQTVQFPTRGMVRLRQWLRVPCTRLARSQKGFIELKARPVAYDVIQPPRALAIHLGMAYLGALPLQHSAFHVGFGFRWRPLQVGLHLLSGPLPTPSLWMTRMAIQVALGWPFHFFVADSPWQFYLAGFGQAGVAMLHKGTTEARFNPTFSAGALVALSWWFMPRWGLQLGGQFGFNYTPVLESPGLSPHLQAQLSLLWAF